MEENIVLQLDRHVCLLCIHCLCQVPCQGLGSRRRGCVGRSPPLRTTQHGGDRNDPRAEWERYTTGEDAGAGRTEWDSVAGEWGS